MPKIEPYQQRVSITGEAPSAKANLLPDVGSTGPGISSIGKGLEDIGDAYEKLQKRKEDNQLTEIGSKISEDILNYETTFKKENKGINASESIFRANEFTKTLFDKYKTGNERMDVAVKDHIMARDFGLKNQLASYELSQLADYTKDVRTSSFNSNLKLAQNGQISEATIDHIKTLKSQKDNGELSPTDYDIEVTLTKSAFNAAYIRELLNTDPKSARDVFNAVKADLTPETQQALTTLIKPAVTRRTGVDIGTEIFKTDKSGSLETMIDNVKAKKLDAETEGFAIHEVKDMWNVKKADEARIKEDAKNKVNAILTPIALKRNGINKQSDLTPAQWSELTRDNPEYAAQLQDKIRKEANEIARQNKAEAREALLLKKIGWSEKETEIMLSPDFTDYDLDKSLALGEIGRTEYQRLKKGQTQADPLKNQAVKSALQKINQGGALAKALNVTNKNAEAIWKQKYGDVVKAFAYNNFDKPDFEKKLTEFMEKEVLADLVTGFWSKDETDRQTRFKKVQDIAGELPEKIKGKVIPKGETTDKYQKGKSYKDAQGREAEYLGNGKWKVIK